MSYTKEFKELFWTDYQNRMQSSDKCVTKHKGTYITGYQWRYRLTDPRKALDFLMQTRVGGKNSQGYRTQLMESTTLNTRYYKGDKFIEIWMMNSRQPLY